ncbi:MAG: prolipoprotein diacylglyceryl transferase [Legionellaceae bacterium]|nr:prolipoprotein diacylglyceryl transferase [Legionellaceae bacterium]
MWIHPQIDPVALHIGPLQVHWYGLMYLLAFASAWGLALWRAKRSQSAWTSEQVSDLIFYGALGVVLGGRLGYMLFYDFSHFIRQPWTALMLWQGGMSFHGGLLGVILAMGLFARRTGKSLLAVTDFIAPLVPLGLALGRMGNFINGELWGRVSDVPWAMVFPQVDSLPRHPSQLYQLGLEGLVLFIGLWLYSAKARPTGRVSAWFLIGYATARFVVEFFREPDFHLGYIAFEWVTMGQLLSIPMVFLGIGLLFWSKQCSNISH